MKAAAFAYVRADSVAQAVELLRVDRVYHEAPIDQRVNNRSVRHLNADGNRAHRPGD